MNESVKYQMFHKHLKSFVYYCVYYRLQDLFEAYQNISQLKKKVKTVLETLKKTKKLTPTIEKSILNAHSLSELDLLVR